MDLRSLGSACPPTLPLAQPAAPSRRRRTPWVRSLVASLALAVPAAAHSTLALKLLTGGLTFLGATADTVSLWDAFGSGPPDDHPLWGTASSSPTLKIVATEFTFELLLQQPNDVGEFEDDDSVKLEGVVTGPIRNAQGQTIGTGELWEFSVTFEADLGFNTTDLDAQGFVRHRYAPHPQQGEQLLGPSLDFNMTVARSCSGIICTWTKGTETDTDFDKDIHQNGKHEDVLSTAELSMVCCSAAFGEIDNFTLKLFAAHPIPEPSTWLLMGAGLGVIGLVARRRRPISR
jgi:hypothetical protein